MNARTLAPLLTLAALAVPGRAHALQLSVDGPALRGAPVVLLVTGADPGQPVTFVYGTQQGAGACYAAGGPCLDIVNPRQLGVRVANARGVAALRVVVPTNAPLGDLELQAVQAGPAPVVSDLVSTAVVWTTTSHQVVDAATYEEARYLLEVDTLDVYGFSVPAPGPTQVSLPWVRRIDALSLVTGLPMAFEAPALRELASVEVAVGANLTVSLPSLQTAPNLTLPSTNPGTVTFPDLEQAALVVVSGRSTLDAPALTTVDALVLGPGDVVPRLDALEWVHDDTVIRGVEATTLDGWFPSLQQTHSLAIDGNSRLASIGALGSPLGTTTYTLSVNTNPVLSSVAGLGLWAVPSGNVSITGNALLPSCDAEATIDDLCSSVLFGACGARCERNLADTCSDDPTDLCY